MAYTLNSAAQQIVSYWKTTRDIPFKGKLISRDDDGHVCMCAQGQVLHIVGGYTEEQLFYMDVSDADEETARILGISLSHSVFLRRINDNCEGSPQDVLSNPAKYLGPNFEKVLELWKHLDTLSVRENRKISDRYWALSFNVLNSAEIVAKNAAKSLVGWKFSYKAWNAAKDVTGWVVFDHATLELIGDVDNKVAYELIKSYKKSSWFGRLTKFLTSWYS